MAGPGPQTGLLGSSWLTAGGLQPNLRTWTLERRDNMGQSLEEVQSVVTERHLGKVLSTKNIAEELQVLGEGPL